MLLCAALALGGCNSATYSANWSKPGVSAAQVEDDWKYCDYEATKYTPPSTSGGVAGGIAEGMHQSELTNKCMRLKGYAHAISG
jgi:hypothetical protein